MIKKVFFLLKRLRDLKKSCIFADYFAYMHVQAYVYAPRETD